MQMTAGYTDTPPERADIDAMDGPVLVEFGSPACGYCRAVQPLLAKALLDIADIPHIRVKDGRGRRLGRSFQVKLWPTLIFMKDGKEVSRLVRPESATLIGDALDNIVESVDLGL